MKIGPMNNQDLFSGKVQKQQPELTKKNIAQQKKDTVEISKSGREKLKEFADSYQKNVGGDNEIIEQISPILARIRNKVEAGYYDLENVESKIIDKLTDTITNDIDNIKKME